jgi:hypothetical protein
MYASRCANALRNPYDDQPSAGMMKAISGPKAPDYTQGELDGALAALGYNKDQVFKF